MGIEPIPHRLSCLVLDSTSDGAKSIWSNNLNLMRCLCQLGYPGKLVANNWRKCREQDSNLHCLAV